MILKCKKCGNDNLFYVKEKYSGNCNYVVNNQGEDTEYNADMYDGAISKLISIYYYCCECNNKVSKIPQDKRY
ncbi:hypothetical protein ABGF26_05260 [Helcococcus ovis]|uniref:hypothetical protein n=1 Tax=Helcococcus ovis TaxID=72026 RepID=UPI0038BD992E